MATNDILGVSNPSDNAPDATAKELGGVRFIGTYGSSAPPGAITAIATTGNETLNQFSACIRIEPDDGSVSEIYAFYSVLLAR